MVSTNLNSNPPTNAAVVTAPFYAKAADATIGVQDYSHGCLSHAIQARIMTCDSFILSKFTELKDRIKLVIHFSKNGRD